MLLKPMAENLLTLKPVDEKGKEFRKLLIFPIGSALEKLEDMNRSGVNTGNKEMFFKLDHHGLDYASGNYDLTFDLFNEGNIILYQTKNAFVEDVGADTMHITVCEDVKKVS